MRKLLLKIINDYELILKAYDLISTLPDFIELSINAFNLNILSLILTIIAFAMMLIIAFYGYLCPYSFLNLALMDKYQLSSSQNKYH